MDGGVAVGAAAVEVLDGAKRLRLRGMPAAVMTGIAHAGHARLQQLRIAGAMWFVAVGAVFHDWGVLPHERPAPFGMAAQAVLVGGALDELLGIRRSVRIVAACAGHLAFAVRHVRRALQLRAPHLVALQAQFRLRFLYTAILRQGRVVAAFGRELCLDNLLDLMAIHAGHPP